jgi:hypothetical protein
MMMMVVVMMMMMMLKDKFYSDNPRNEVSPSPPTPPKKRVQNVLLTVLSTEI